MYWKNLSEFCEGAEFLAVRRHKSAERWIVGHCTCCMPVEDATWLLRTYVLPSLASN